jgi:restriction endonuclease S subunit
LYKKKVDIETDYVWYYIQSQAEALKALRHGTSQPNLNANDVANFEIIVPPISDQQRIVAQIEQYEAEIRKAQAIMDDCPARKKAILDKYLS